MIKVKRIFLAEVVVVALFCAGCTSFGSVPSSSRDDLARAVAEIQSRSTTRGVDASVEDLMKLADRNPTSGLPWSAVAKLRFDQERYGPAIVAADEALQREADDDVAKSIRVVGGLRIAQQSLSDMRGSKVLLGKVRPDALALARVMRETLGITTILAEPTPSTPPRPSKPPETKGGTPFDILR
jgi:hypothetical protein